jgi:hypothetical protein
VIFERWILAADRLGALQSSLATASFTIRDLSNVLNLCEAAPLASELAARGPVALTELGMDDRNALAARVEPTLKPSLKSLLLVEAVEMEKSIGTAVPCRLVVMGRAAGQDAIQSILNAEFPHQRGTVVSLSRPTPQAVSLFDRSRHQLIWPERTASPVSGKGRPNNVERVRFPSSEPPAGALWNLNRLAGLNPRGLFYSSFASKPLVTFGDGETIRYGGLSLIGSAGDDLSPFASPELAADILFASGARTLPGPVPVAFLRPTTQGESLFQEGPGGDRVRIFLNEPKENYGRIDFDPLEQTLSVSLMRTRNRTPLAKMDVKIAKDRDVSAALTRLNSEVVEDLTEAIQGYLRGGLRRERAEKLAKRTAAIAYPMACRYVEWIERHPEAPVFEREQRLKDLERAMIDDVPADLVDAPGMSADFLRRDLYLAFQRFLTGWGLRVPS